MYHNLLTISLLPCDEALIYQVADSMRRSVSLEQFAVIFFCVFFSQAQYVLNTYYATHCCASPSHAFPSIESHDMLCRLREKLGAG